MTDTDKTRLLMLNVLKYFRVTSPDVFQLEYQGPRS